MKVQLLLISILFFVASFREYYCIKCMDCFSQGVENSCRLGTSKETCEGKICYSYMYDLDYDGRYRQTYFRGCTPGHNECGAMGVENCTLCADKDFCNGGEMPTRGARSDN
ncbi:hypothetical protein HHI36_019246 [Cryptolaemus montrouzieri]|uniref:Uncharacterized protein n=1 Tax=Cryptolaemus montrouzieri TaxID=559131 RepID=A0ABD2P2V8_9CUCU